jgi:hypothetical protein
VAKLRDEEAEVDVDHPPAAQARPRSFQQSCDAGGDDDLGRVSLPTINGIAGG